MRILLALAGLHRVDRGAEVAFTSLGVELARGGHDVTLIGSGPEIAGRPYRYLQARCIARERFEHFPKLPFVRQETAWEELTFFPGLLARYRPADYDVTLTCGFPFTNLALRRPQARRRRPPHVFVTQNGDWPAYSNDAEYRLFDCNGLICTNPEYFERNRARYPSALLPNGVDLERFSPGPPAHDRFGFDPSRPVILMVSALIGSKFVDRAIDAVANIPDATLVVAGDGPLRRALAAQAEIKMPGRYHQLRVSPADMPDLYRTADVFLHLSRDESFGNVFVEALAVGVPVVAYDLPRTRWIIGECGFLAAPTEPLELVRQIRMGLSTGAVRRDEAVQRASDFAWPKIAARYQQFLEGVIRQAT